MRHSVIYPCLMPIWLCPSIHAWCLADSVYTCLMPIGLCPTMSDAHLTLFNHDWWISDSATLFLMPVWLCPSMLVPIWLCVPMLDTHSLLCATGSNTCTFWICHLCLLAIWLYPSMSDAHLTLSVDVWSLSYSRYQCLMPICFCMSMSDVTHTLFIFWCPPDTGNPCWMSIWICSSMFDTHLTQSVHFWYLTRMPILTLPIHVWCPYDSDCS